MSALFRAIGLLVALVFVTSLLANQVEAQVLRGLARTGGYLPGSGYHVLDPLTDSSYYQPYSETNSLLYTTPTSGSRVAGIVSPGASFNHGVEFGSYPGNLHGIQRTSTPTRFRWNSPHRGR